MKAYSAQPLFATALIGVLAFASSVRSQDGKGEKLVDIKDVAIQVQKTPDIPAQNVSKKRWTPKDWIEVEVPFVAIPPKAAKGDFKVYESLTFKYYVLFENPDPKKRKTLTADLVHTNVPVNENVASVAYISPSTILALTGSNRAQPNAVTFWGVEVTYNGNVVGFLSSRGKSPTDAGAKWWESDKAPAQAPGMLLNKMQTPFAPLWGDYHCDVQSTK
jgi:hypothetical protein